MSRLRTVVRPGRGPCGAAGEPGPADFGATLVELVIAVTIVLALAGATLLSAPGIIAQARHASCDAAAGAITNAVTASFAKYGHYAQADNLVPDAFLTTLPASDQFTIEPASAEGVAVTFGPECSDDYTPTAWLGTATNNTYSFGNPAIVIVNPVYQVGDVGPGGGTIVYALAQPDWWGQYIEAAPTALAGTYAWGCSGVDVATASGLPVGAGIGDGATNLKAITLAGCGDTQAVDAVIAYDPGSLGLSWHLPSQAELHQVCLWQSSVPTGVGTESTPCPGDGATGTTWTSTQTNTDDAVSLDLSNGDVVSANKTTTRKVWPVRTF